jgi:ornithine carbamoyltransferase
MGKDFLTVEHLEESDITFIFDLAHKSINKDFSKDALAGKIAALVFEKPSNRTRLAFEVAALTLGAGTVFLGPQDIRLREREAIKDVARVIEKMVDLVIIRTFEHAKLQEFADYCQAPVINALSDLLHPSQVLADMLTIEQVRGKIAGAKLSYIGDGNNVLNSLMLICAKTGVFLTAACPVGYKPNEEVTRKALQLAKRNNCVIKIIDSPLAAVKEAEFVYTDVWTSMGQEEEREVRSKIFASYQVNSELIEKAAKDVKILHCLPAHRGEEITDEVLEGENSVVFQQAENRLHIARAIMQWVLK